MKRLDEMTWPAVTASAATTLLAVPVGSTEQHGPHLPVGTDTAVAVELAERLAHRRDDVVVAPAVAYGSSGEHAGFAGTLSIGAAVLEAVLVELGRSADAFAAVVFVSAHGGNAEPLAGAVATLRSEGRRALGWAPRIADGDAHAGRTETSLMLALRPEAVSLDDAAPGDTRPLREILPVLRADGLAAVTANGVLGDPTGADAAEGGALLESLADQLALAVQQWAT